MGKEFDQDQVTAAKKPETKGFRKTASRLRQGTGSSLRNRASLDWQLDQRAVCETGGFDADIVKIEALKEILLQSRTGQNMLESADAANLEVVYDLQNPGSQFYVRGDRKIITLNPHRPLGDLVNMFSRELRRVFQHAQGALVNPLSFEPEEAILVNRAQAADAFMISVKVAWELKLAGLTDAWDYISASSMGDVSRCFEIKAQSDFRSLNNGEAARAAYDKFFEDNRTRQHDKRVIHQMLLEETGYIKSPSKRDKLSMDLFRKLGEVPQGRNYLSMQSTHVPTDSCYSSIEDRSNANFLWFIKFERSFQEKELQMIEESVKLSAEIVDFTKWSAEARRQPA